MKPYPKLIWRSFVPVAANGPFCFAAVLPSVITFASLSVHPDLVRENAIGMLLRETATMTGSLGATLVAIGTYIRASEHGRGFEEFDVAQGIRAWHRHVAFSGAAWMSGAIVLTLNFVLATIGCLTLEPLADFRTTWFWALSNFAVLPLIAGVLQIAGAVQRIAPSSLPTAIACCVATALGMFMPTTRAVLGVMGDWVTRIATAVIPDFEWVIRLVMVNGYSYSANSMTILLMAVAGAMLQAIALLLLVRLTPLSKSHLEVRSRVKAAN